MPLDSSVITKEADFTFNPPQQGNASTLDIDTTNYGIGSFIVRRAPTFSQGEVVTISYTPNADPTKRIKGTNGAEMLSFSNFPVTNNL